VTDRDARIERLYAKAEEKNVERKAATIRRGPISLVVVCLGVSLIVGVVAAIDLRRLQTPRGTAMAWTGAAVFGDCTAYQKLSVERRADAERDADQRCLDLRVVTAPSRDLPSQVSLEVLDVREDADRATALIRVARPGLPMREVELTLEKRGGDWDVVLDEATCEALPCP
jgi:hypothetical protein